MIKLSDFPQLQMIAWSRAGSDALTEEEALALYERNWSLVDKGVISKKEQALIDHLVKTVGNGVFHV